MRVASGQLGTKACQLSLGMGPAIFGQHNTKGFPRRINQVCTTACMAGLMAQKSIIDGTSVRMAIADLEHE